MIRPVSTSRVPAKKCPSCKKKMRPTNQQTAWRAKRAATSTSEKGMHRKCSLARVPGCGAAVVSTPTSTHMPTRSRACNDMRSDRGWWGASRACTHLVWHSAAVSVAEETRGEGREKLGRERRGREDKKSRHADVTKKRGRGGKEGEG